MRAAVAVDRALCQDFDPRKLLHVSLVVSLCCSFHARKLNGTHKSAPPHLDPAPVECTIISEGPIASTGGHLRPTSG
jgi:hypothetical protein